MTAHGLTIKERIQAHIISKDGCWITNYRIDSKGRPQITINGKSFTLTRVVYELYKEDSPKNLFVCHSCANLLCINPDHLYTGTSAENGRNLKRRNLQPKGSRAGNSKLNETQVMKIRDLLIQGKLTFGQIGEMFGVSFQNIRSINDGRTWTHVEGIGSKIKRKEDKKLN
jgi:hypothetical protein